MTEKKQFLADLDNSIFGTIKSIENSSEPNFKVIRFYPFNSLVSIEHPDKIHINNIFSYIATNTSKGVEKNVVAIFGSKEKSIIGDEINRQSIKKIKELEQESRQLKLRLAKADMDGEALSTGMETQKARERKSDDVSKSNNPRYNESFF